MLLEQVDHHVVRELWCVAIAEHPAGGFRRGEFATVATPATVTATARSRAQDDDPE
jgi:hypothetical protein